ncbi:hypothetical protein [Rhodoferax saidenbachensis]|uniref:Uncharacterized protein n=1 Tax=Rhodoferax saidenbachensis TaxID=1484693 RepID=A0A1P8K8Y8_9BURK|nr:hypothetical protein [Rhodoferax saidenbachensis]APW42477.1 hypothetical protein RS694_07975 [Rhodoferax saidenbachensis]
MRLAKTAKAKDELKPGVRTLGQRERALLLLIDGEKTLTDLAKFFQDDIQMLALQLIRDGYLLEVQLSETRLSVSPDHGPVGTRPQQALQPPVSADQFNGKRSLATTRMFLFDMCERMFVKRSPEQAESFREALRNARDRESMLAVGRAMILEIEKIAGQDRANSISERISLLLPDDVVTEASF